jgi:hypothetical protein
MGMISFLLGRSKTNLGGESIAAHTHHDVAANVH